MKVLQLNLLRFGPFSGESLLLDRSGLQIVYGRNEAGKSSALRALRQLLYGIPNDSSDNFLHAHPDLRIGAVLESRNGPLELIRRKGRKDTLRAGDDDAVVAPERLQELLGGVDLDGFCRQFGIDYEGLVAGGKAICAGQGDVGQLLFAAGAGTINLTRVQRQLEDESGKLFRPRASTVKMNAAIAAYNERRKLTRDTQLSCALWQDHEAALRSAQVASEQLQARLFERRTDRQRLDRLQKMWPLLRRLEEVERELVRVDDAPLLPADAAEVRSRLWRELGIAEQEQQSAQAQRQSLIADLAAIVVPEELLLHDAAIERLKLELGSHLKARSDRVHLVQQRTAREQQAQSLIADTGWSDATRIPTAQQKRIHDLAEQRSALAGAVEAHTAKLGEIEQSERLAKSRLDTLPPPRDPSALRRAVQEANKLGDIEAQRDRLIADAARLQQQVDIALKQLPLWSGLIDDLRTLPMPPRETIERFAVEFAALRDQFKKHEDRTTQLQADLDEVDRQIEHIRRQHDVPTEDDLQTARQARDELWSRIQQQWRDPAGPHLDQALVGEFEAGVRAADEVADRMRREANVVATLAGLQTQRRQLSDRMTQSSEIAAAIERRQGALNEEWQQHWRPLGIAALPPAEMREWMQSRAALLVLDAEARAKSGDITTLNIRIRECCNRLSRCLAELNEECCEAESLGLLGQHAQEMIARLDAEQNRRETLLRELERLADDRARTAAALSFARDKLAEWTGHWASAVQVIQLDGRASPSEANSRLRLLQDLLQLQSDVAGFDQRIRGIDAEAEEFQRTTAELVRVAAPDLASLPASEAAGRLHHLLGTAREARALQIELEKRRRQEERRQQEAEAAIQRLRSDLAALCRAAGVSSADELPQAEERSRLRRQFTAEFERLREQLRDVSGGMSRDELVAEVRDLDVDQLKPRLQQLDEEIEGLNRQLLELREKIGTEQNELRHMDGSGRAAEAQESCELALSAIRSDAEEYVRLRLAQVVLQQAIERYRKRSQGPVLHRASGLFQRLTLGSYQGLRTDNADEGRPILYGIRAADERSIPITGMSEGTCDQLYLALRLASLEHYLDEHEPLPFVVDDILIKFDDQRAAAALQILAELSRRTQVIVFTHHEHLLDVAEKTLSDDAFCIHRLGHSHAKGPALLDTTLASRAPVRLRMNVDQ